MQDFLHCVWSPRMPYSAAEDGEKKKKKKKSSSPLGIPSGERMPQLTKINIVFNFDLKMLRPDDDLMLPGRSFHILGSATEKAWDFITDEVVKGTQSNWLSLERRLRDGT